MNKTKINKTKIEVWLRKVSYYRLFLVALLTFFLLFTFKSTIMWFIWLGIKFLFASFKLEQNMNVK